MSKTTFIVCCVAALVLVWFAGFLIYKFRRGFKFFNLCADRRKAAVSQNVAEAGEPPQSVSDGAGVSENVSGQAAENHPAAEASKPIPASGDVPLPFLRGEALWQWWALHTGQWEAPETVVVQAAELLCREQAEELCCRYQKEHPQLYDGIFRWKNWRDHADVYARVVGMRLEVLLRKAGKLKR